MHLPAASVVLHLASWAGEAQPFLCLLQDWATGIPEPGTGAGQVAAGRCGCPLLLASSCLSDLDSWEVSRAAGTVVGLGLES